MPRKKERNLEIFTPGKISLRNLDKSIPGAKNFKYSELIYSKTATSNGLVNVPNETQWKRLETLAEKVLQPIREKFGKVRINSGYRCVELCKMIGSPPNSKHTQGFAADIEVPDSKLHDVVVWINNNLSFSKMIAEYLPSGWIHIEYDPDNLNGIVMVKDKIHNYTKMNIDEFKNVFGINETPKKQSSPPPQQKEEKPKTAPPPPEENEKQNPPVVEEKPKEEKQERKNGPFENIRIERDTQKEGD